MKRSTKWRRSWRLRRIVWSDLTLRERRRRTKDGATTRSVSALFGALFRHESSHCLFTFMWELFSLLGKPKRRPPWNVPPQPSNPVNQSSLRQSRRRESSPTYTGLPPFLEASRLVSPAHFQASVIIRDGAGGRLRLSARLPEDAHLWAEDAWRGHDINLWRRRFRHVG